VIARRTIACLGLSQLVCWGISYYPIGELGVQMTADLGWSRSLVYGGFSVALAIMGLASAVIGRLIDRHGGRSVMAAGASNGVLTITRGTVPLALFGHRGYGGLVGSMLVPGYVLSAVAPMVYALVIERVGPRAALMMSAVGAAAILAAAVVLKWRSRPATP
jgi:MFS family permease